MMKYCLAAASLLALAACASAPAADAAAAQSAAAVKEPEMDQPDGAIRPVLMASAPLDASQRLTRIIFASCAQQNEDQAIFDRLAADKPDLTLYIGDNVYGDVRSNDKSLPELKAAYARLAASAPFARLRAAAPMLTTWDDHDYGMNDAGDDYPYKAQSEALFEHVWALVPDDPRRAREGVHSAWTMGPEGERVQVILLDTRYFRSPLKPTDQNGARGRERWLPDPDPAKTMLGAAQWAWFEDELKKPADLRLIVSSIQVMSEGHGWEAWRTFPLERQKFYDVIRRSGADGVIVLSGDRHSGAFYERDDVIDYPLFEATSSSLNLPASKWRAQSGETYVEEDPNRTGAMEYDVNYGRIDIDWQARAVTVSLRDPEGAPMQSRTLSFASLQRGE
jgi:alkaline phosphatase D